MSEEKARPCPSCGGVMRRGVKAETVTYKGESPDLPPARLALRQRRRRHPRRPTTRPMTRPCTKSSPGRNTRRFRPDGEGRARGGGVSQREAGRIFGGGPTAFYKYETARAVPSEGMANLIRRALEPPDLFHKRAPSAADWPSAQDADLLRRTSGNARLNAIVRRVYPQVDAEKETIAG